MDDLGSWLKEERQKRGWSQEELARRLLVHSHTVANWERGLAEPRPIARAQLEIVFRDNPVKEDDDDCKGGRAGD